MNTPRRSPRFFTLTFLCHCLLLLALVGNSRADKIDDYIKTEMEKQRIPGLSIAVVQKGNVVRAKGYGYANLELNVPVTKDTAFLTGSVGKQFTSAAVLLLVEDGKISLDEKISKYLTDTSDTWKEITVRHLLTHTSGLKDYQPDINFSEAATDAQMLAKFFKYPLDFAPGEHWSYSNLAYVTLGILVKQVSGKFYGDFLKERVFTPLGMTATQIYSEASIVPNRADGYYPTQNGWRNQEYVTQTWNQTADGSVLSTASDMAKWAQALRSKALFKPTTYAALETPVRLNNGSASDYSMGWFFGEARGHEIIEHGGAWLGFRANISRYVDDDLSIIILANSGSASPETITHGVAERMLPALSLTALKVLPDPDAQRTRRLQSALQDYVKGRTDSPDMAVGLRNSHAGTQRSRGALSRLDSIVKGVKSFTYWNRDDVQSRSLTRRGERIREILYYKLTGERNEATARFYLTGDGKLADFGYELTPLPASRPQTAYVPAPGDKWEHRAPEAVGMDAELLAKAVAFAKTQETDFPRDFSTQEKIFGRRLGPLPKERGGTNGLVIRHGYIVAEFGDTHRADPTYSAAKSFLSTLLGVAIDKKLIQNVNDPVANYVSDGGYSSEHNRKITWHQHAQQTSEWEGTLWGKNHDFIGETEFGQGKRQPRALREPGTFYEYNDVRVNRFALSLLRVFQKPLPEVLKTEVMNPIGASGTWRWVPYDNAIAEVNGKKMPSVSGGTRWGGGLWISTRDEARFGLLFLRQGRWGERQVISEDWIKQALTSGASNLDYGYLWWLNAQDRQWPGLPKSSFAAVGHGSNTIWVDPERDLIVVWRWHKGSGADFFRQVVAAIKRTP